MQPHVHDFRAVSCGGTVVYFPIPSSRDRKVPTASLRFANRLLRHSRAVRGAVRPSAKTKPLLDVQGKMVPKQMELPTRLD